MATLGTRYITFRDLLSGRTPNGFVDREIVEMMAQENPVLQDVMWKQCNKGREDFVTIRTGMPEAVLRSFYEGFKGSKTSKKQVTNACCTATTGIEFDWRLYEADKDKAAFLADEQRANSSTLGDKVASLLIYGDSDKDPKGINGFCRTYGEYGAVTGATMQTDDRKASFYCFNAGAASQAGATTGVARRSLLLVGWGARSMHGIYPEGSSAGIKIGQLTSQYVDDGVGGRLKMGLQEMNWDAGLNIRDFRYGGRVANIDVMSDPSGANTPDVTKFVRKLVTRAKSNGVTQRFYCSRLVMEFIAEQFEKKTSANAVKYADLEQRKDASLLGIPVSICDCMNADEPEVPAVS